MKPIELNNRSWHYHLAHEYGGMYNCYGTNICEYTKCFLISLAVAFVLIPALVTLFLFGPILTAIYVVVCSMTGGWFNPEEFEGLTIGIVTTLLYISIFGFHIINNIFNDYMWSREERIPKKASFIKAAYRSMKDKYCVPIKWTNDSGR